MHQDWLGFPSRFPPAVSRAAVGRDRPTVTLGELLSTRGDTAAQEPTDLWLWYDRDALRLRARCHTKAMDRIRTLAARPTPYGRDAWGDDALEVQIDPQATRRKYCHFILPPNGRASALVGFNNRQEQGWYPSFDFRVTLEAHAWVIEAAFPFAMLERTPAEGEVWGLNVMRVNPSEPSKYVQWAPTLGDALRPELFGEICFSGQRATDRAADIAAYARHAAARKAYFLEAIKGVSDEDALKALGVDDWETWGRRIAQRQSPLPLRWEDSIPGKEGIPAHERPWVIESADQWAERIAAWSDAPADPAALMIESLEALGDAYLLTGQRRYVEAFERAIQIHVRRVEEVAADVTDPHQLPYRSNPYYDMQIVRAGMLSYAYLSMRNAGLSPRTHSAMMRTLLRGGRFAAFNIATAYNYGNHQVYESAGLAAAAALFPEFDESDSWARVAGRSIQLHLQRELYPDGGYMERCGYHCVALTYTMHALATIRLNAAEKRFPELTHPDTVARLERMHDWVLAMLCPDGTLPAFGDCGASSHLRMLQRGAAIFQRHDLAWPLQQLAPGAVPAGLVPRQPDIPSAVSLESQFTVLRGGWKPTDFYIAVDHGPLGGQHSHTDTLGFVAYAHGRPVALDSGIGVSYEDPRYIHWFRSLRAHNVIAIDELETDKVACRLFFKPGPFADAVGARSLAYQHTLGLTHDRTIFFVKNIGWLILDHLHGPAAVDLSNHKIDWILHTPFALQPEPSGTMHAAADAGGLLVIPACPESLGPPRLEMTPAALPVPQASAMRLWDVGRIGPAITPAQRAAAITTLAWPIKPQHGNAFRFAALLAPYAGARPEVRLSDGDEGVTLRVAGQADALFRHDGFITRAASSKSGN